LLDLKAELIAEKAKIVPELEGWRDIAALNIKPATGTIVSGRIDRLSRRLVLIDETLEQLDLLDRDGYPDTPDIVADADLFRDIEDQVRTIAAAFKRLVHKQPEGVTARIVAGAIQEQ